jgi:tRNA(Arg) A34 adenosine deaminase TadA
MTRDKESFMREACRLAEEGLRGGRGGPFGCVVVRRGEVVGRGQNQVTSEQDPTAHAEVVAIRDACRGLGTFQLADCELYTSCEPCPMCLAALYWSRCAAIYFGNTAADAASAGFDDSFLYAEIARPLAERKIPTVRLLGDEAIVSFDTWCAQEAKIKY